MSPVAPMEALFVSDFEKSMGVARLMLRVFLAKLLAKGFLGPLTGVDARLWLRVGRPTDDSLGVLAPLMLRVFLD